MKNGVFTGIGLLESDDTGRPSQSRNSPEVETRNATEAFTDGYSEGYNDAKREFGDAVTYDPVSPEILSQAQKAFPNWINEQEMSPGLFSCNSDVRLD